MAKNNFIRINKGNSSIPLFKTRKSIDKKQNRGNKLILRGEKISSEK